jgi:cardiolipin synthase (CMP-forming)
MLHHIPNALCVLRMLMAVPVAVLLARGAFDTTLWVFGAAAISDGLDGFLAKRFNWTSELGKALDPLADKILLVTAFITLALVSREPGGAALIPMWIVVPVVLRDIVITTGAIVYVNMIGPLTEARPTIISKLNTLFQLGYVLAVVAAAALTEVWPTLIAVLATLVLVTTVASGIDYIATYAQRAIAVSRSSRSDSAP